MLTRSIISRLVFLLGATLWVAISHAQCPAPTAATLTPSPAACQGQGRVVAKVTNPPAGAVYQYQLQFDSTTNTSVVKPWQASDTFNQVGVGRYKVYIRRVCNPNFSTEFISSSVTVSSSTTPLSISQAIQLSKSSCGNGKLSVTATGGNTTTPYQYALVPTLSEPEPVANYVRPQQSSNIFANLPAGTYYARAYDGCGTYTSATIVIDTVVENAVLTTSRLNYIFYGCDSLRFYYNVRPSSRIQTGASDPAERFWVKYNGVTDTIPGGSYYLSGGNYQVDITKTIKPIVYPAQIVYGYKSLCGTVYEQTVTVNAPVLKLSYTSTAITCANRQYSIRTGDSTSSQFNYYNTRMSLDNGLTWSALNTSYQYYDTFTVGNTYNIWVASGCDTEKIVVNAVVPSLSIGFNQFTAYSCNGNSGFGISASNYSGNVDSIKFNVLSRPAASTLPDSFYMIQESGTSGSISGYRLSYDIPAGAYSIKATDACGATNTYNFTINPTVVAFTTSPLLSCQPSQSGFRLTVTETNYQPYYGYSAIRVIVTNTGTNQVDSFTNNTNITTRPVNVDVTGLANGTYSIRVIKVRPTGTAGLPYPSCSVNGTYTNTSNQPLSLTQSTFTSACTNGTATVAAEVQGGGGGNQFYLDVQGAGSSWTLVAGPQSGAVFNNLLANNVYRLRVTDVCGNGTQYSTSFSNTGPTMDYSTSTAPCPGDAFTMGVDPNPAALYAWQKNSSPIAGATNSTYTLNPVPNVGAPVDTYKVKISYGSCDVFSISYAVNPVLCGMPLPLSLLSFGGFLNEQSRAQLQWEVANFEAVRSFDVEYSDDGSKFTKAGSVLSTHSRFYQFGDEQRDALVLYYRLKMLSIDGESSYSPVLKLNAKGTSTGKVKVYPTIVSDRINIRYSATKAEQLSWKLADARGSVVRSGTLSISKGESVHSLNGLSGLADGTYILLLNNGTGLSHYEKIVIRK